MPVALLALTADRLRGPGAGCRRFLDRDRNRRLRRLGQIFRSGCLLRKEKWAPEKNGRQQESSVGNTSGHR